MWGAELTIKCKHDLENKTDRLREIGYEEILYFYFLIFFWL